MESGTALNGEPTSSCNLEGFRISSAVPTRAAMTRLPSPLKPLLAGLLVTLAQIAMAVYLLAPEGPLSYRYSTLIQHDSYWFENIVDRGYQTIVPPISHKMMEVSNVAFFPLVLQSLLFLVTGCASTPGTLCSLPPRQLRGVSGVISFSFANGGIFRLRSNFLALYRSSPIPLPSFLLPAIPSRFFSWRWWVSSTGAVQRVVLRKCGRRCTGL